MSGFMRDGDAFAWYMERDPTLRSTVVAITWLERSPDWDTLVARVDRVTRLIPMFRERVREAPWRLATPRWTPDATFDLTRHVRRTSVPPPHTAETVMTIARAAASEPFDRSRPLWELTLVDDLVDESVDEGVDRGVDGGAAVVMKLHHSLTDGIGGVQLGLLLFDMEPDAARSDLGPRLVTDDPPPDRALPGEAAVRIATHACGRAAGIATRVAGSVLPTARRAVCRPFGTAQEVVATVRSIGRTVAPVNDTMSPIMTGRGEDRHLDVIEVRLDDLRRAATVAGGTVNDAFLAAVTGGLRRYHERHATPVDELRVTLPVSIRTPDDPVGGNRITLIRFAVPVADQDPDSRLRRLHRLCIAARHERSLQYTDDIAASLNLLPRAAIGSMLKHVDFVASDIPGFTAPVFLAGTRVVRSVAFGPTTGTAVNFTLLSSDGTCCVGVNVDTAAVPDPEALVDDVRDGFEEVLTLAGDHSGARRLTWDASTTTPPGLESEHAWTA